MKPITLPRVFDPAEGVIAKAFNQAMEELEVALASSALNRVVKTAAYTAKDDDEYIGVDTTSGVVTITLPKPTGEFDGETYLINDEGGNAGRLSE